MRNIKRAGILMVAATSALIIGIPTAGADHGGPHCDELPADITESHPDWDPALDSDNDGVACESGDGGGTPGPTSQPEPAPDPAPAPASAGPAEPQEAEPTFTG